MEARTPLSLVSILLTWLYVLLPSSIFNLYFFTFKHERCFSPTVTHWFYYSNCFSEHKPRGEDSTNDVQCKRSTKKRGNKTMCEWTLMRHFYEDSEIIKQGRLLNVGSSTSCCHPFWRQSNIVDRIFSISNWSRHWKAIEKPSLFQTELWMQ